jgi:hypothetical protein
MLLGDPSTDWSVGFLDTLPASCLLSLALAFAFTATSHEVYQAPLLIHRAPAYEQQCKLRDR